MMAAQINSHHILTSANQQIQFQSRKEAQLKLGSQDLLRQTDEPKHPINLVLS